MHWHMTMFKHSTGMLSLGIEHSRRFTGTGVNVVFRVSDARDYLQKHGASTDALAGLEDFDYEADIAAQSADVRERITAAPVTTHSPPP